MRRAMSLCGCLLLVSFLLPVRDRGARGDVLDEIREKYEEWRYPNAIRTTHGGISAGVKRGGPNSRNLEAIGRFKTRDDFLSVVTFYTGKIVEPLRKMAVEQDASRKQRGDLFTLRERLEMWAESPVSESFAVNGVIITRVNSSHRHPVRVRILTRNSPGKSISVVLTRAEDQEWTYIDWVYSGTDDRASGKPCTQAPNEEE